MNKDYDARKPWTSKDEGIVLEPIKKGDCPNCGGDDDGRTYTSNPPKKRCSVCGKFWIAK